MHWGEDTQTEQRGPLELCVGVRVGVSEPPLRPGEERARGAWRVACHGADSGERGVTLKSSTEHHRGRDECEQRPVAAVGLVTCEEGRFGGGGRKRICS